MSRGQGEIEIEAFKRVTSAALRAVAARPEVNVTFVAQVSQTTGAVGTQGPPRTEARLTAPPAALHPDDVPSLRGEADSLALNLRYHDQDLHARQRPAGESAGAVFDAVEQVRVEALGSLRMAGIAANLSAAIEERCRGKGFSHVRSHEEVSLAEVVGLLARETMTGVPLPAFLRRIIDLWRPHLGRRIDQDLVLMNMCRDDQKRFAEAARRLIIDLDLGDELSAFDETRDGSDSADGGKGTCEEAKGIDLAEELVGDGLAPFDEDEKDGEEATVAPDLSAAGDKDIGRPGRRPAYPGDNLQTPETPAYKPFTSEFDEVSRAENLCSDEELTRLRVHLDEQIAHLKRIIGRLANRLQRRLLAKQARSWEFNLDEGLLDSGRLARVIVNPLQSLSFKMEKETDFRDTVVTLLIDNSGSMRGRPITVAAASADILARTLERCAVKVEILGFTTRAWKGGQARERWVAQGKPRHPGRLNDLRHIIYKSADAPWRRTRKNLGLMLREGFLKENIDGEALLWAHHRLLARPEQRRILIVISDGAPVDDSTLSVNPGNLLERHLREVIEWIETLSPVELIAIGIGHDVTRYYHRAVTIVDAEQLGGTMMEKLAELFDEQPASSAQARVM